MPSQGLVLAGVSGGAAAFGSTLACSLATAGWCVKRLAGVDGLADEERVDAAFDEALAEVGDLRGLVIVADLAGLGASLSGSGPTEWEAALMGPLRASFLVARRGLDELMSGGAGGRVLLVVESSPAAGTIPATLHAGLVSLSKAIANEYGRRGIACNALIVSRHASSRIETALEAARFLLSNESGYVTGEVIDLRIQLPRL
jgi:NAD(P)-dependent dehydrogenase (short-subunit alcohol dehydrogenase family)